MNKLPVPTNLQPWRRAEIERLRVQFATETHEIDGALHWNGSGNMIPPCVYQDALLECPQRQADAYSKHLDEVFAERCARQPKQASGEELLEMRAAFGPGVEVVDVITGRRTRT